MNGKNYDQLEMELDTASREAIKVAEENEANNQNLAEKPVRRPAKKPSEPQTISIEEIYENDDDDDDLIVPRAEVFKKHNMSTNPTNDYVATFHGTETDNAEDVQVNEAYISTTEEDQRFMSTFGIGAQQPPTIVVNDKTSSSSEIDSLQGDVHSDYYEYTDRQQRKEIVGMYKYAKKNIKVKTIIASIFAVLLFLIENITLFVKEPTGIFANPYVVLISSFVFSAASLALLFSSTCVTIAFADD